ncbi:unnamed protein product, partial [Closterium sp. NIES-53]
GLPICSPPPSSIPSFPITLTSPHPSPRTHSPVSHLVQVCARTGHGDVSSRHLHLLPQRCFLAPSHHSKSLFPSHYPFPYPSTSQVCARAGHGDMSRRHLHLLPQR